MGAVAVRSAPALVSAVMLASICCGGARQTAVGGGWYVDDAPPGQAWPHLYYEDKRGRTLVDRQIEAYRLYASRCLIYEAPRENGRFLFVMWAGHSPIAFRTSEEPSRWRLDTDGPRRFETPLDPDGHHLLDVEWINFGDPCSIAQLQPPLQDGWRDRAPFDDEHVKSEKTQVAVEGEDSVGNSTLADAAYQGKLILVDELLRAGADVNSSNQAGVSVLMGAVAHGDVEVVRRLIEAGARVNAQDSRGESALMYAAQYGRLEIARVLIAAGARTALRDDAGRTALVWLGDRSSPPDEVKQLRALLQERPETH